MQSAAADVDFRAFIGAAPLKLGSSVSGMSGRADFRAFIGAAPLKPDRYPAIPKSVANFRAFIGAAPLKPHDWTDERVFMNPISAPSSARPH